ncbi:MAG: DUF86 domain-containing protein [Symploca sp. SIO2D2]|nr:DUF86 domain-containing protein [Symploca sp. SIO2D2]
MLPREINYLLDMLQAAQLLETFVEDVDREAFDNDLMRQAAVIRELEIIGEAARRISDETHQELTQIPWQGIIGMRNRLIHEYDNVDLDLVWETIQNYVPQLIAELVSIVPPDEEA